VCFGINKPGLLALGNERVSGLGLGRAEERLIHLLQYAVVKLT
jgi:hypothetical protein